MRPSLQTSSFRGLFRLSLGMLSLRRTYNSFGAPDKLASYWSMGLAWRHNFDVRLTDSGTGTTRTVLVYRDDGHQVAFQGFQGGIAIQRDERLTLMAYTTSSVRYEIIDEDGRVESYDADGRLTAIRNIAGLGITLSYDSVGRLAIRGGSAC
ncbi:DUF6531 domain-containing protein [Tahibacter amnicola]|uniref:RHS repeat domain-containing protein n=1 Tax=Tahibacter amnicola TaxID=2976241 RepID=UPI003CCDA4BF